MKDKSPDLLLTAITVLLIYHVWSWTGVFIWWLVNLLLVGIGAAIASSIKRRQK